jgi:hypothetical protein
MMIITHLKYIVKNFAIQTAFMHAALFRQVARSYVGWDSRATLATRNELDGPGSGDRIPVLEEFFHPGPGTQEASYTMGTRLFPAVKRPGRDVNHPLPSSAEVKEIVYLYLYSAPVPSCYMLKFTSLLHALSCTREC